MNAKNSSFSKKQLRKWGWKEGKGLGKVEDGIKSAIKVKRKNNMGGLGHDHGTDFSFHWWDHIFNKAASSIEVCEDEKGESIEIKQNNKKPKTKPLLITNKKPGFHFNSSELLYGTFVKAGTAVAGKLPSDERKVEANTSEDSSSNEEEDLSTSNVLEKTFKKTGLTGHKAARHGHQLKGKLKRIKDHENDYVDKKKSKFSDDFIKKHNKQKKKKAKKDNNNKSNDDKDVKSKKSKKKHTR